MVIEESIEKIRKYLKFKILLIENYLNIVYQYYCDKKNIKYIPLFKSKILIKLDKKIILLINQSMETVKKILIHKIFPIYKYLNIVYRYYCNKNNIEFKSLVNNSTIKLDNNIIEILDRMYLKYPYIKIEEPLYDFDVDYP